MTAAGGVGFTPGPWKFVPAGGNSEHGDDGADMGRFIGANGSVVCDFGDGSTYYPSEGSPPDEADARLIAAAPDLLEALVALFNDYKRLADSGDAGFWNLEDVPEGKQALAAIAKATGQDSALSRARGG